MLEKLEIKYGWLSNKGYVRRTFFQIIKIADNEKKRGELLAAIRRAEAAGNISLVKERFQDLLQTVRNETSALFELDMATFTLIKRLEDEIASVERAIQKIRDTEIQKLLRQLKGVAEQLKAALGEERNRARDLRYLNKLPRDVSALTNDIVLKVMANDARVENNIIRPLRKVTQRIKSLSRAAVRQPGYIPHLQKQISWFAEFAKKEIFALVEEEDYVLIMFFRLVKTLGEEDAKLQALVGKGFPRAIAQKLMHNLDSVEQKIVSDGAHAAWANEFLARKAA